MQVFRIVQKDADGNNVSYHQNNYREGRRWREQFESSPFASHEEALEAQKRCDTIPEGHYVEIDCKEEDLDITVTPWEGRYGRRD